MCFARYDFNGRTLKVHFDRFAVNAAPANGSIPVAPAQYTGAFSASMAQGTVAAPTAAAAATALDLPGLATGAGLNVSGGIPGLPVPGTGAAGPAGGTALAGGAPLTSSPYVLMRPQQPSPYVQQAMQRNAMLLQQQQQQHHPHSFAASFLSQNQPQHFPPYDKSLTSAAMRSWPPDRNSTTNSSPAPPPASSAGPSSSASPSPALTAAAAATEDTPLQRTHSIASHVSSASHASNPSGEQRRMERPSLPLRGESSPSAAADSCNRGGQPRQWSVCRSSGANRNAPFVSGLHAQLSRLRIQSSRCDAMGRRILPCDTSRTSSSSPPFSRGGLHSRSTACPQPHPSHTRRTLQLIRQPCTWRASALPSGHAFCPHALLHGHAYPTRSSYSSVACASDTTVGCRVSYA